ncbi:MAG: hypothetical protein ACPLYE_02400, partial [Candidatus Micrarchaeales archaeon]
MIGIFAIIIILAFDFAISIWNAYASGYNIGLIKKRPTSTFSKAAAYSGLGLAFVGITYVLVVVLSFVAYVLGYIDIGAVEYALAFNFIVFGLMIISFGFMITVQSIIIAAERRSIGSILRALWNIFAEVWDIANYVEGFKKSISILSRQRRGNARGNALVIVVVSLLIAYFITHAA